MNKSVIGTYNKFGENCTLHYSGEVLSICDLSDNDIINWIEKNNNVNRPEYIRDISFVLNDVLIKRRKNKINKIKDALCLR